MTGTNSTTNQAARRYGPWAVGAGATLLSVIFFLSIGLGATAVIRGATGSWEGLPLMVRLGLAGLAVGVSCTLAYRICQTESNKFMTVRHKRGDLAATFGVLVGMGLAGYWAPTFAPQADEAAPAAGIGQSVALAGPTVDGGKYDLAAQRGKVVLIDFWASWCGPCVAELPNVRTTYDKYHDQKFDVVSVSLDFESAQLKAFLGKHDEPWPQIYFDAEGQRGFDSPLAKQFNIQAIPQLMLVDADGKLLARDLRGSAIEAAVREALHLPVPWSERAKAGGWALFQYIMVGLIASPVWLLFAAMAGVTVLLAIPEAMLLKRRG